MIILYSVVCTVVWILIGRGTAITIAKAERVEATFGGVMGCLFFWPLVLPVFLMLNNID